jgi:BASS family bile acid:Na+ symporter
MTAGGRDNLLEIGLFLIVVALIHNMAGYVLGYWSCRALKMDEKSCRTIAFEVGLQNAGLATGLAQTMGKMATVGLVPTVFGSLMNITGAALATWWRDRPPRDERAASEPIPDLVGNVVNDR